MGGNQLSKLQHTSSNRLDARKFQCFWKHRQYHISVLKAEIRGGKHFHELNKRSKLKKGRGIYVYKLRHKLCNAKKDVSPTFTWSNEARYIVLDPFIANCPSGNSALFQNLPI